MILRTIIVLLPLLENNSQEKVFGGSLPVAALSKNHLLRYCCGVKNPKIIVSFPGSVHFLLPL